MFCILPLRRKFRVGGKSTNKWDSTETGVIKLSGKVTISIKGLEFASLPFAFKSYFIFHVS